MNREDDALHWINFLSDPSPDEIRWMNRTVGDATRAAELLKFGFRPFNRMDEDPYAPFGNFSGPLIPGEVALNDEAFLVDLQTGWRFRYAAADHSLVLDLKRSDNWMDAQELLSRMETRSRDQDLFKSKQMCVDHPMAEAGRLPVFQPIEFHANSREQLNDIVGRITHELAGDFRIRRWWFRGQRQEYYLDRSSRLSEDIYGMSRMPSLYPSLGRYAQNHPDKLGLAFSYHGPNHFWKKPFLIWLMRENEHWFRKFPRCMDILDAALMNDDDHVFSGVLNQIEMYPLYEAAARHKGEDTSGFVRWPDEADDLRQWFFSFMKRHEFAITMQQYGYVTSLLDVTQSLDVALYFSQASMIDSRIVKKPPAAGRVIYVFAERGTADFFKSRDDLFWGSDGWVQEMPPRLKRQKAGFMSGSTDRIRNFYGNMIVAKIWLGADAPVSEIEDEELFPDPGGDLLLRTFKEARPSLEGLY